MKQIKRTKLPAIMLAVLLAITSLVMGGCTAKNTAAPEVSYNTVNIFIDGTAITKTGESTQVVIVDDKTYLPFDAISEVLSKQVEWDNAANSVYIGANPKSTSELYNAAVQDAMVITDDEIFPLVEISKSGKLCSWNDKDQVLMLTYHSYPDSYVAGEEYTLKYGAVWTFTDKEIIKWYQENKNNVTDWELRFKQLIGLPENRTYTHFSAFWANTDDIIRPGYSWKLSDNTGAAAFAEEPSEEYKAWFDSNIIWSYYDSAYPWTRLGYTYDWACGSGKYGLSEFLVRKDAVTHIEFTLSTEEFVAWLEVQ